jgi:hypothetical protein
MSGAPDLAGLAKIRSEAAVQTGKHFKERRRVSIKIQGPDIGIGFEVRT